MKDVFTLISSYDALPLSVICIRPQGRPRAVVQFAHGTCGCKERFLPVMEFLAENGYVCVANDHRGHGGSVLSGDDLGYMYEGNWKALVSDMRQITEWALKEFDGLSLILLGHSMGSLAVRTYVKLHDTDISGLIVCGSPSYDPLSVLGRFLTRCLCALGLGRMRTTFLQEMTSRRYDRKFHGEGKQVWTCSDPEVRRAFAENPLCNFRFTANASYALLSMMHETYSTKGWTVNKPDMPVLFLSGEDDPCIISRKHLDAAVLKMKEAGYGNVRLITYPGMRHEVLNEKDKMSAWKDILFFLAPLRTCSP